MTIMEIIKHLFLNIYLDELIKIEKEKFIRINEFSPITEKEIMNAICPSICALFQNMLDYDLEYELIYFIFGEIIEKYNFDDEIKINISSYLTSKMIN